MANKWAICSLDEAPLEIIDGDRGKNYPKRYDFFDSEYCLFLNAGNVTIDGFNFSKCSFVTEEKDRALRKGKLTRGDIVLTTRGTVGNVAYYDSSIPYEHVRINSGMVIFRSKKSILDTRFLYFLLRSQIFKAQVNSLTTGSAQPQLPIRDINRIRIPIPPLPEQRAIAHILGAFDDKIELNREMNQTIEAIARAIFKSWFVDFDPVHAKAEGRAPVGMDAETAALFPDRLVESELGLIPEGWEVCTFLDVADILSGGTPRTSIPKYWNGDIAWVSAKDVRMAQGTFVLETERTLTELGIKNSNAKILPKNTTVVTARGTVGNYCLLGRDMSINQTNYGFKARQGIGDYFVFFSLANLVELLKQHAYGTIFDTVTTRTFKQARIVQPSNILIDKFENVVFPLMSLILQNLQQSRTLSKLRDTLLPKLISGQLRVPEMIGQD